MPKPKLEALDRKKETKTRRKQLLLTPSLYDRLKASADKHELSVNEYINIICDECHAKRRETHVLRPGEAGGGQR